MKALVSTFDIRPQSVTVLNLFSDVNKQANHCNEQEAMELHNSSSYCKGIYPFCRE